MPNQHTWPLFLPAAPDLTTEVPLPSSTSNLPVSSAQQKIQHNDLLRSVRELQHCLGPPSSHEKQ